MFRVAYSHEIVPKIMAGSPGHNWRLKMRKQLLLTGAAMLMAASSAAFAASDGNSAANPAQPNWPSATSASERANPPAMLDRAGMPTDRGGMFVNMPARIDLTSKVVGLNVYNNANQNIGKIKDVAFDSTGVTAYIVAVGGFLGMGDHYVAVKPSAIDINYDVNNKTWHASMNTNADELKAAPEYKYSSM
jgi:hypothetical protein